MKIEVYINVICPECGNPMTHVNDFITCDTRYCSLYGRKFQKPTLPITEIGDEEKYIEQKQQKKGKK